MPPPFETNKYFLPIAKVCPACDGQGKYESKYVGFAAEMIDCDTCKGQGKVTLYIPLEDTIVVSHSHDADNMPVINTDALADAIARVERKS